jgi:two-component system sensor histidine kinase DesK
MTGATVPGMAGRIPWRTVRWSLPWLLFLGFPIADLMLTPRPLGVRLLAAAGLAVFTIAYVMLLSRMFAPGCEPSRGALVVVVVLAVVLSVGLGTAWAGLLIYVAAGATATLPQRWVWPAVLGAAAVCTGVVAADGLLGDVFILPIMCLLTAFALQGTRHLVSVNAELVEAREELARSAVAEERLRFARDLHDLLGHSLSLIALKSELAGRLAERDPARAREEMADVEAAARRALAEVRDAVSGYREVSLAQALAEARSALSAAGITLRSPVPGDPLPGAMDAVLGWVVREATTNVLRHSGARSVTVDLVQGGSDVTLTVTDDGTGATTGSSGAGLAGLAERVAVLGGRLVAGPAGSSGFRLAVSLPVSSPVAQETVPSR